MNKRMGWKYCVAHDCDKGMSDLACFSNKKKAIGFASDKKDQREMGKGYIVVIDNNTEGDSCVWRKKTIMQREAERKEKRYYDKICRGRR